MAQEVLVSKILTREMIDAGAELLRHIDPAELEVTACLWLFTSEPDRWRLIIASPVVDKYGPLIRI